ncbi:MAG: TonB-dependent receptor [Bacteroidetes bacterium]|nr:TonB-dependent receptor [Bacteroidota bacterium]
MRKPLLLLLLLIPFLGMSQRVVTGRVVDGADKQPLQGASVVSTANRKGASTDKEGKFSIRLDAVVKELIISYTGYESQTLSLDPSVNEYEIQLKAGGEQQEVVITGTRAAGRVSTQTPVPVDVLSIKDLTKSAPQANLNQILNYVAPSFTSNTMTVADGTDHIDPAQLRGLGPDQVLVLLNSKRRHTSSLVNVNGTPGRGSVGTDLNAIPAFAIDRIEVLRDGAAAQYGSDAIAGVINVVMKKGTNKLAASLYTGGYVSAGANDHRGGLDGGQIQLDLNYGLKAGRKGGFVNITASGIIRDETNRATDFNGAIYNIYNAIEKRAANGGVNLSALFSNINNTPNTTQIINTIKQYAPQVTYLTAAQQTNIQNAATIAAMQGLLGTNVTNDELNYRGLTRRDFNMRIGQSRLGSGQLFANAEFPLTKSWKVYAFGGFSYRNGNAAGFYRRPNQNRTSTELYLDGFLPEISSDITDGSIAAGIKGKTKGGWNIDFSNTLGQNKFQYTIKNTVNTTLGVKSPTEFDAGGLSFLQNTINLDVSKPLKVLAGGNIGLGAEFRLENYQIDAGTQDSYERYDIFGNPATPTTPANLLPTDFFGSARPGGAQVFPGFRPENELSETRSNFAAYADLELNITNAWLAEGAIRFENYSDFGSTFNYKFATRIKAAKGLNLRAAVATGFRAPSQQQKYFNATATQFIGGVPFEVGTFPNTSKAAEVLGIPKLKQEESFSASAGFTYKLPGTALTITVDGYYVKIKDRIVLTGQFSRPSGIVTGNQLVLQQAFDAANASAATFFTNAINTESKGIDYIVTHQFRFEKDVRLKTDLAGTVSFTQRIGDIKASDILKNTGNLNNYFNEASRIYLESAVPRSKLSLMNTLTIRKLDFFIRQTYFGKVTDPNTTDINGDGIEEGAFINGQFIAVEHPVWGARTITDFSVGYELCKNWRVTLGANNIFDIYPDRNFKTQTAARPLLAGGYSAPATIDLSNNNQFEYSRNVSQFGFNGRFLFLRLNVTL